MNAEEKNRYFQELTLNLQHEGFAVKPETEEGLLPIELDGQRLCLALDTGSVRYWREDTADDHRSAALDKAISITKTTAEYMRQMETAPQLTASGLTGDYRLLADFNDVVLAGHPTRYGVQFATWERVRERTGLNAGNFYGPPGGVDSYTAAKRDFATRSGLIPHVVLFTPEQLKEVIPLLMWIDREMESTRQYTATEQDTPHLISPDRLLPVPDAAAQLNAVWMLFQTAVNAPEDYRQTLLETARTLTEMGGLEDMLLTTKIPAAGFVSVENLRTELEDVRVALHLQEAADHIAGQPGQMLSP